MEKLIAEIVRKLHYLSEVKVLEVLDFVEFLSHKQEHLASTEISHAPSQENEEFEAIRASTGFANADRLADEFQMYVKANTPHLSDYAVSRAGIYEEHP